MPFLGSALGYLIVMCSPGWVNLVAFDWNDFPWAENSTTSFWKMSNPHTTHTMLCPPPLPPFRRLYIDRCIQIKTSHRFLTHKILQNSQIQPRHSNKIYIVIGKKERIKVKGDYISTVLENV